MDTEKNGEQRVALITGSASGIGLGIARYLARKGMRVVINDLNQGKIDQVVTSIRESGGEALGVEADVTQRQQVEELVEAVRKEWGRLDILVNNAGIARDRSLRKMTEEDWDRVVEVNLKSAFVCSKAVAETMIEHGFGRIINIASRAWLGWFGQANYAASKGGLISLTRSLAIELGKRGITVNAIAPGLIDTPLLRSLPDDVFQRLLQAQPSKTVGTCEDIARAVAFFASEKAGFITGQVLYVCGGKSLLALPASS